jgi:hypothetical protein
MPKKQITMQLSNEILNLLKHPPSLIKHIMQALHTSNQHNCIFPKEVTNSMSTSAVLFLLGFQYENGRFLPEPCLILNKRSQKVRQPGDLCCPGGSMSSRLDSYLSRLLYWPGSPLTRWPYWNQWRKQRQQEARTLTILFATSLRESFEEMRLNPLKVKLLGPLPSQELVMFHRVIYPVMCWVNRQKRFRTNWEVEKIVYIPLKNLLDPSKYAHYRLRLETHTESRLEPDKRDFLCFIHDHEDESEHLWGATFRITMAFLELVFGFKPPEIESLPLIDGVLGENYYSGIVG